jgi:hypothetical protein
VKEHDGRHQIATTEADGQTAKEKWVVCSNSTES